jgi:two-component system nitrate/nitrite sensor histidine kinase NarX
MQQGPKNRFSDEDEYRNIFEALSDGLIIYDIEREVVVEANHAAYKMHGYTRSEFIGLKPSDFMTPESCAVFVEHIHTVKVEGEVETLAIHTHKDGSLFHVEVCRTHVNYQGHACLLSDVRNVSQRIQAEQALSSEIEVRRLEQATLLSISHTLASTLELQPTLILDQLSEIIQYDHGCLFVLQESTLTALAIHGMKQMEQSVPIRIHLNTPETLVTLFNSHQPICISDLWSDDPQAQFLRSLLEDGAARLLEGMQSWMWVPLAVRGRIIGGVGMAENTRNYFTPQHADLALSVANQAAITMINAELYGHAQELAVLEERQRLARNLHDAVNQSLFSAGLIAEVLPRLWDRDQQEARRSLEDLRRLTRGAMAEMRSLLAELRPSTLIDSDLGDLLRQLGNALEGRTNLPVVVNVTDEFKLPSNVQIAFYRICQEAINNIAKHAKANRVEINLKQDGTTVELHIRDDGLGFDTQETFAGHYGLGMMRERAETMGLLFAVTSQIGHGTELTLRWNTPTLKESI